MIAANITPDSFSAIATAWIGAVVTVLLALAIAIPKIVAVVVQIREAISSLQTRQDAQSARMNTIQSDVTKVALATPPASDQTTAQK